MKNKSVTIPIKDYLDIRNNVTSIVMEFLNTSFQGYSVEIDLENSAVIIGLNNDTDIIELMSICTSIIDFFNSQIKVIRLTIGVSSQTDNIFKISECYRNTLDIIDNRSISGLSEIVLCDLCSLKEISIGTKELKIYSIINYVMDGMYDEAMNLNVQKVCLVMNLLCSSTKLHATLKKPTLIVI